MMAYYLQLHIKYCKFFNAQCCQLGPVAGQNSRLLLSHFTVNFGKKLKIRKRSNKNNSETSASNVRVEIKAHLRTFKHVYLSKTLWKLIEGLWNAWDIFTGLDPRYSHLPKWHPHQRKQGREADIAGDVFSKGQHEHVFFLLISI